MANPRPCECGHPESDHSPLAGGATLAPCRRCWVDKWHDSGLCPRYRGVSRTGPLRAKPQVDAGVRELVDAGLRIMSFHLRPIVTWSEGELRNILDSEAAWWVGTRDRMITDVMRAYCRGGAEGVKRIRELLKVGGEDRNEIPWNPEPSEPTIPVRELRDYLNDKDREWRNLRRLLVTPQAQGIIDGRLSQIQNIRHHFNIGMGEG